MKLSDAAVTRAMSRPTVKAQLQRHRQLDRTHDIPYLAGYSANGNTVYIDRHIPIEIPVGDRGLVDVTPYLLTHEEVEKSLIDALGYHYRKAHSIATIIEHMLVKENGLEPPEYEAALKPYIKGAEHEAMQNPPTDLDLTPYRDDRDEVELRKLGAG